MDEQVFLQEGNLVVTSTRVEVGGQTFATRNIGSVKVVAPGASMLAMAIVIVGVLALASNAIAFGLICVVLGGLWTFSTYTKRELRLMAGGGEVLALSSTNGKLVERIRAAIAQAISVR